MELMSAKTAGEKWGITQRRVAVLCAEGRIPGASIIGNSWVIPKNAKKPEDARLSVVKQNESAVRPFLKWAGGKGQLLAEIEKYYPFDDAGIIKYAEPFVGGGAVLFDILSKYELEAVYISDTNAALINVYEAVRDNVSELIERLEKIQAEYLSMDNENRRKIYILNRERFNCLTIGNEVNVEKAALMIFLNRTCFNGLYRVNRKGQFNVPIGSYKKPLICDEDNLRAVAEKLKNVEIVCGDYTKLVDSIDEHTFVYIDPPYRPLTDTANFTSYTEVEFDDAEQIRLARFVDVLSSKGARLLVSNSDPKNANVNDDFFDKLYSLYNIHRVTAARMINSNGSARGEISELLISNFPGVDNKCKYVKEN